MKRWHINRQKNEDIQRVKNEYNVETLAAKVILARGLFEYLKDNNEFEFEDPFILKDMEKAVDKILTYVENFDKITIYGDYDADGVTSTALLYNYLCNIGANVDYYIPNREKDGYGLTVKGVEKLQKNDTKLIITVDNGISAIDAVDVANSIGIEVIITDHHQPSDVLPKAFAVVDPHRNDCESKFKMLSGVGVVFKLVCALEDNQYELVLDEYGDLVTIGTISDIMPLIEDNRKIVKYGLNNFRNSNNEGVNAIVNQLNLSDKITETDIGFLIAPRINAAGRVKDANEALKLFITDDIEQCEKLAENLSKLNDDRKNIESENLKDIEKIIENDNSLLNKRVLVVVCDTLNQGIIGILASRLCNKYLKPVFVFTKDGENVYKGSARSVGDFNLHKALTNCSDLLLHFGGHKFAAGLSIESDNITYLEKSLNDYYKETLVNGNVINLEIDTDVYVNDLTIDTIKQLNILGPFGEGNRRPLLLFKNVKIKGIYEIGKGNHIRIKIIDSYNKEVYITYFNMTSDNFLFDEKDEVDIVFEADINNYNKEDRVSLKLVDIKISDLNDDFLLDNDYMCKLKLNEDFSKEEIDLILPSRDEIAIVYKTIKENYKLTKNLYKFYYKIGNGKIRYIKMLISISALRQKGLIKAYKISNNIVYKICDINKKVNIMDCEIINNLKNIRRVC
ncbi:MAG: single-stranded-DNA-specific exonuclease RecJ [Oscillospiraceae bacterium]